MKSALFVDFDNVYSGLRKLDPAMADQFAQKPQRWMQWLVSSLELPEHARADARRRVLVRRCYLNPQAYQRFRPSFNLAGFEIIDCPSLTSEGKTSTDIHMVLDIIDLLQHEAHYDEFIVFSADADFTPVLRKLRRWDRRTTVLAIGFPSAAYRASADLLIDPDDFVRDALGFRDDDEPAPVPVAPDAEPSIMAAGDLAAVTRLIKHEVAKFPQPVACARIAQIVTAQHAAIAADWNGAGSFRKFVEGLDLTPLKVDWNGAGGRIYDPGRHVLSDPRSARAGGTSAADWGNDADLLPVAAQIHDVTDVPLLAPDDYQALFRLISQDLAENAFELNETGKRVRDSIRAAGHPVSRADVTWVLRGLLLRGHEFGKGDDAAATLARKTADNVRTLCLREQMVIDLAMDAAIGRWIRGL